MSKILPSKPLLIILYGYPGAGKSHFGRELKNSMPAAYISSDELRYQLFEHPRYEQRENDIIENLMSYMAKEFLAAGVSVIYDINANRLLQRRVMRDMARKAGAEPVLVWFQIDADSAFARVSKRDRRKADDRFATPYDKPGFEAEIKKMQNPHNEDYVVVSGKHTFNTQRSALVKRLYEMKLIDAENASSHVIKPGLVNLVPNPAAGRVDISRRNIVIH
jgi:predicted kinase